MVIYLRPAKTGGWILPVKVTPKGGKDCLIPITEADTALRIKVSAPPEKGEANTAVITLLAKSLELPKTKVSIAQGETSRQKQVALQVDWSAETLQFRLAQLFEVSPECFVVPS